MAEGEGFGIPSAATIIAIRDRPAYLRDECPWDSAIDTTAPDASTTSKKLDPWPVLEAGALLTLTGMSQAAIARRLAVARSTVNARLRRHRTLLETCDDYAEAARSIGARALRLTFPESR